MDIRSLIAPLLAQEGATTPAADTAGPGMLPNLLMFGAIGLIFYFLLIRPQQKQEKVRKAMLESMKKKDRVLTSGGLLGTVADIRDDELVLKISENPDVKVRVRRSSVVEVLDERATAGDPS